MSKDGFAEELKARYREQERELERLERTLDELATLYEQYFMGLEKREPSAKRDALRGLILRSGLTKAQKTPVRFRFGALQQRFATLGAYWDRIARQIEEGTFKREGFRRFKQSFRPPPPEASSAPHHEDQPAEDEPTLHDPPQQRQEHGGYERLYDDYIQARQQNGESVDRITYSAFVRSIERQAESVRARAGGDVELVVTTREGRVALVARTARPAEG